MSDTASFILACDIGGTHITSAIVNAKDWTILPDTLVRNHVDSSADAKSIFQNWSSTINLCQQKHEVTINQIGIAMPGPFNYEEGISLMKNQDKYDALYKLNVSHGILEGLNNKNCSIKYINDAAAFLQGEVYAQQLQHKPKVLGITLGTGLGSAVWSKGHKAFDADLWNTPYKDSIFEEYLVTRWFTNRFEQLSGIKETGLKEIIEKHQETAAFQQLMSEYRIHLIDFLKYFSELHCCKDFIIGGNIAKAWNLIDQGGIFSVYHITHAQYAEKAALIGAASIFE